jgi:DNA repair exonuclease SbcCD ATPase subunit
MSSTSGSIDGTHQLMDDLRERLGKAELAAEELKKNNESLQIRLDEANKEQAKQEEKMHEDEERIEELENAKRDLLKQKRELETIFEAERAAVMKEKDSTSAREEDLQHVIQRLKESLSNRDSLKPSSTDDLSNSRNCKSTDLATIISNLYTSQFHSFIFTHHGCEPLCTTIPYQEQLHQKQLQTAFAERQAD